MLGKYSQKCRNQHPWEKTIWNQCYLFGFVYDEKDFSALIIIISAQTPAVPRRCFY